MWGCDEKTHIGITLWIFLTDKKQCSVYHYNERNTCAWLLKAWKRMAQWKQAKYHLKICTVPTIEFALTILKCMFLLCSQCQINYCSITSYWYEKQTANALIQVIVIHSASIVLSDSKLIASAVSVKVTVLQS